MTHYIKIKECYADAIMEGRKTFEVRLNDRGYNSGDCVCFLVFDEGIRQPRHNLDGELFRITYVHSGLGMQEGYVVFGIERVDKRWQQEPGKESRRMIDDERRKAKKEAVAVLQKWLRCARFDGTVPISMKEANPELARAIKEDLRMEEFFFSSTAERLLSRYEKEHQRNDVSHGSRTGKEDAPE